MVAVQVLEVDSASVHPIAGLEDRRLRQQADMLVGGHPAAVARQLDLVGR